MAIYNMAGDSLMRAYDKAAEIKETAYNMAGSVIFSIPYAASNMVSYFRQSVIDLCEHLRRKSEAGLEHILFLTDPHGTGTDSRGDKNYQHSQNCALYLLNNAPISMMVLGGDYCVGGWSKSEFTSFMNPLINSNQVSKIYALMGNHETYSEGSAEAKSTIYNSFLKNKTLQGNPQQVYYYFDNATLKTRYMFINTSDGGTSALQYTMTDNQINWIKQNVVLPSKSWSLLVFGHVNISDMELPTYANETNGSKILQALNNCNGTIIGYICGHQHIDKHAYVWGVHQTTLLCDKCENYEYYPGYSYYNDAMQSLIRESGTIREQAFTLITIDRKNKEVRFRRIGCGSDRTLPLAIKTNLDYKYK